MRFFNKAAAPQLLVASDIAEVTRREIPPALSRNEGRAATICMESFFEVAPDADRDGGFSIP